MYYAELCNESAKKHKKYALIFLGVRYWRFRFSDSRDNT